ncbi:hypothetical protein D9M72_504770 [compost metagenome]
MLAPVRADRLAHDRLIDAQSLEFGLAERLAAAAAHQRVGRLQATVERNDEADLLHQHTRFHRYAGVNLGGRREVGLEESVRREFSHAPEAGRLAGRAGDVEGIEQIGAAEIGGKRARRYLCRVAVVQHDRPGIVRIGKGDGEVETGDRPQHPVERLAEILRADQTDHRRNISGLPCQHSGFIPPLLVSPMGYRQPLLRQQ